MGDVDHRLVDKLTTQRRARETREALKRRRDGALRLPPLPSGHRDPLTARTDAPARRYFSPGGETK